MQTAATPGEHFLLGILVQNIYSLYLMKCTLKTCCIRGLFFQLFVRIQRFREQNQFRQNTIPHTMYKILV